MLAGKRSDRVGGQILKVASTLMIEKIRDPRLAGVTISGIDLSRDLKSARLFFSVIGGEEIANDAKAGLESAKGLFKREIARQLPLRYVPELFFQRDTSMERGMRMENLFEKLKKDTNTFE